MMTRRAYLQWTIVLASSVLAGFRSGAPPAEITVYHGPGCGCCLRWAAHLRESGFVVRIEEVPELGAIRDSLQLPLQLRSCHLARVEGYALEGHVPGDLIARLLREAPDAIGLAVPGMPPGSPGMESSAPVPYEVLLVQRDGTTRVYAVR